MRRKKQRVDTKNAEIVKRSAYVRTLNAIVAAGFCPFCEKHIFKHHRRPLIYKGRYWLVTENAWPYAGVQFHFLFITRQHIEATEEMFAPAWSELQKLYKKLVKKNKMKGATLMIRSGDTRLTGASVNHLHAHLVAGSPRNKKSKPVNALISFSR